MLKVGSIEEVGGERTIHREWYEQGFIFKDEEAYRFHKDKPCYVPELSDQIYTGNDFLKLCNGQGEFADELFEYVDWEHPESAIDDWVVNGEWVKCKRCGKFVNYGDGCNDTKCIFCGWEVNIDE